jgi:hypothetical protein
MTMTVFRRITTRLLVVAALAVVGVGLTATPASAACGFPAFTNLALATGPGGPVSTNPPIATVETLPIGGAATLRARLYCDGVEPIVDQPGQSVTFYVYSGTHAGDQVVATTDSDGWATATIGSDEVADDYWVAKYTAPGLFVVTSYFARVVWTRAPTVLTARPALLSLGALNLYGPPSATLTSPNGPLAGKVIQFSAGGAPLCTATTNATGVATCSGAQFLQTLLAGGYTAAFAGDAQYVASTGSA